MVNAMPVPLLVAAGYVNVDLVARVPQLPGPDQRVTADRIWRLLGGMAANVACAAASLGQPWPVKADLITFVGEDGESDWALHAVEQAGVHTDWCVRRPKGEVPRCLILVEPDGQRVIVSEPMVFDDDQVARYVTANLSFSGPRLLHVDGYRVPSVLAAVTAASDAGWRTSIDLDGAEASWRTRDGLAELAQHFDVIFVNRNAIAAIWPDLVGGPGVNSLPSLAKAARDVLLSGARTGGVLVATLGREGALVVPRLDAAKHIAAISVEPVDTTGAGDVFAGVFLALSLHDLDPVTAGRHASMAAGLSTTGFGAQGRLPVAAELQSTSLPAAIPVE